MKEVLSDLKTLTNKGCKIVMQEKFVFGQILPFYPHFLKSNLQTF